MIHIKRLLVGSIITLIVCAIAWVIVWLFANHPWVLAAAFILVFAYCVGGAILDEFGFDNKRHRYGGF